MCSMLRSTKYLKNKLWILWKLFQNLEADEILLNSFFFFEANTTLVNTKTKQMCYKKRKTQTNIFQ